MGIQIGKIIRYISNSRSVSRDFRFIFVLYVYLCYHFFCWNSLFIFTCRWWYRAWWILRDICNLMASGGLLNLPEMMLCNWDDDWWRATWWCHLIILYYNMSWTLVILLPSYMDLLYFTMHVMNFSPFVMNYMYERWWMMLPIYGSRKCVGQQQYCSFFLSVCFANMLATIMRSRWLQKNCHSWSISFLCCI